MPTRRVKWLMMAALLTAQQAAAAPREAGPPPDADFLEFLGSWQTGDDHTWVDPFQVDDPYGSEPNEPAAAPKDVRGQPRTKQRDADSPTTQQEPAPRGSRREMTP